MEATFDGPTKLTIRGRATLAVSLVSMLTLCITLTCISSSTTEPHTVVTAAINKTLANVSNSTLCSFLKHFPLSRSIIISVCLLNKHIRVDIRHFVNDKPTIRGIYLYEWQWNGLLKLLPKIISTFHEIKDRDV